MDVEAAPRGKDRFEDIALSGGWTLPYDNPRVIDCSGKDVRETKNNIMNALANMPDGTRYGVQVLYSRSGHVFIAEKHGNDIVFMTRNRLGYRYKPMQKKI